MTFLYIALIYFAAVAVWRRFAPVELPWKTAIFFYLLVFFFLFRPLTQSFALLPADFLTQLVPWEGHIQATHLQNMEINDVILQMVPWAHQVRQAWHSLEFPLWNSNSGCGYPLLANGQSSAFSPLRLLGLPLTLSQSFSTEAALKLLIGLTFAYLYLRRRGASEIASIVTGVSFGFSTFLIVWLQFPHAAVACMLPALFLAMDLLIERRSYNRYVFCTAIFTLLLLGGHPETAAHIVFASGLYLAFLILMKRSGDMVRSILAIGGAGLTSIVLSLVFLLPFIEALPYSQRFDVVSQQPDKIVRGDITFVVPTFLVQFYGTEKERNLWGPGIAETLCGYAGMLGFIGWIGSLLWVVRRRQWTSVSAFFVFATPVVLGIALGWRGIADVFHSLPLFSMAANARMRLIVCWFLAILAGQFVDLALARENRRLMLSAVLIAGAVVTATFTLTLFPEAELAERAFWTSVPAILVLIASAFFVMVRNEKRQRFAVLMLVALAGADLWFFGLAWNPVVSNRFLYPSTPLIRFLQSRSNADVKGERPFRIAGTSASFFPNSAAMYGFEDIRAHDPMSFSKYLGALRVFMGYTSYDYFGMLNHFEHRFLDYLNVRFVVTAPSEDLSSERFAEVYSGKDGKVFENRFVHPRFFAVRDVWMEFDDNKRIDMILENSDWREIVVLKRLPSQIIRKVHGDLFKAHHQKPTVADVKITRAAGDDFEMTIDAPRWTLIASSQPFWPGWRIYRNGNERLKMIEINGAFTGFLVPKGRSRIRMYYTPLSFWMGLLISGVTLLVLIAVAGFKGVRMRAERISFRAERMSSRA